MIAVVTGPSRGIGRATARLLAAKGYSVALLGRPSGSLDDALAEVRLAGVRAEVFACDLAEPSEIKDAAGRVLGSLGVPRVVVNNAGVIRRAAIEDMTLAEWDEQLDVNVRAPFLLSQAFLPEMRKAKAGCIIHVASISSTIGSPLGSAYCASKWALVGFMKSLAEEISGSGVVTLAVLPGSVDTNMLAGSGFAPRMTAEDVAETIVFYAERATRAHNGSVVEMFGV
ncbi:MAG TPA: SDR family oxidoreductase [Polyangiaceae bacterium]|nr:SDR family oxidoreductase [Polyangiaceae bacterium]